MEKVRANYVIRRSEKEKEKEKDAPHEMVIVQEATEDTPTCCYLEVKPFTQHI